MIARTLSIIVAFGVAMAGGVPAGSAEARPAAASSDYFGINISALVTGFPRSAWGRHLDAITRSGVRTVRTDAPWNAAEPNPPVDGRHRYDWSRFDALVGDLASRNLRWIPIIDYSARWAASQPGNLRSPPRAIPPYAAYGGALAARYGRDGSFWRTHPGLPAMPVTSYEIWNAPDFRGTFVPPAYYADLYVAAREEIRAADPSAQVWIGGLGGVNASDYLHSIARARPAALGQVDAIGIHPYAGDAAGVLSLVSELRLAMDVLDMADVPIAITEFGWTTQGSSSVPHASDPERAANLARVAELVARSDCGVNAFIPYTWVTAEQNPKESEHWFGITRPDGRDTATSRAYARTISGLADQGFPGRAAELPLCERVPRVTVRSRSRRTSPRRSGSDAAGSRASRRAARRRLCHEARVTLAGGRLAGARVRFDYRTRGNRSRRRAIRRTDESGVARFCFTRRARRAPVGRLHVTAVRADLAAAGRRQIRARLP